MAAAGRPMAARPGSGGIRDGSGRDPDGSGGIQAVQAPAPAPALVGPAMGHPCAAHGYHGSPWAPMGCMCRPMAAHGCAWVLTVHGYMSVTYGRIVCVNNVEPAVVMPPLARQFAARGSIHVLHPSHAQPDGARSQVRASRQATSASISSAESRSHTAAAAISSSEMFAKHRRPA